MASTLQERWEEAVNSIDFSYSSHKAWSIINKLTGRSGRSSRLCPMSVNSIASQLVRNGHTGPGAMSLPGLSARSCPIYGRSQHLRVTVSLTILSQRTLLPSGAWGQESLRVWILSSRSLYSTPGRLSNLGFTFSSLPANSKFQRTEEERWLLRSLSQKRHWRTQGATGLYLCCVSPFKILERLNYARVETIIDSLFPQEQAGFRHGRSTVDQVILLTQEIEDSFSVKKKASAVFVNFIAAYDTVWHRGLTCKLLRLLHDKHMVRMIMEMVGNRSFTLTTGNSKCSRLRRHGVPQGCVL